MGKVQEQPQVWSKEELLSMGTSKSELIAKLGLVGPFDYSLPQEWLNWFCRESGLEYHTVLFTTVWSYAGGSWGTPVSCWDEVVEWIERLGKGGTA